MQRSSSLLAAAALFLSSGAWAGGADAGRAWDDSHMRTRHSVASPGVTRPKHVVGQDRFTRAVEDPTPTPGQTPPESLDSVTQHSWAAGGHQSISFGTPRQRSDRGGDASRGTVNGLRGSRLRSGVRSHR